MKFLSKWREARKAKAKQQQDECEQRFKQIIEAETAEIKKTLKQIKSMVDR